MIIPALIDYYNRLVDDPESDIAPYGFSYQQISFEVVLSPDGTSYEIHDARESDGKKSRPRRIMVLGQAKPSGSGLNPCTLWDNAQYMLGFKTDDPKPERTLKAFAAFREKHLALKKEFGEPDFDAVCAFLSAWGPGRLTELEGKEECLNGFGLFRIQGQTEYIHQNQRIQDWWVAQCDENGDDTVTMPNLVSGDRIPIARIHEPKIKRIRDAQSSGATIVSFNKDSYESYGKEQGTNSPIGVTDAFKYCTALNTLTNAKDRRLHLGDMTIVFWADKPSAFESEWLEILGDTHSGEDQRTLKEIRNTIAALGRGKPVDDIDPGTPFYILGLAPNAARLSVRMWLAGTIGEFAGRLDMHLNDLEIEPIPEYCADLSIRRLIAETAPPKGGWADEGAVSPLLAGSVLRAILTGGPYPRALLSGVLNRVRIEGLVDDEKRKDWRQSQHRRCAIIKACLTRNARFAGLAKEIPVSLKPERPEIAYQLGRLFAALEKSQEDAMPGLNATIKDRYFGSASATPGVVFPRLCRLHQHHIEKLEGGLKVNREKLIQEIIGRLEAFPSHLSLDDQGLFAIGYYHQRQFFFTKKEDRTVEEPANT